VLDTGKYTFRHLANPAQWGVINKITDYPLNHYEIQNVAILGALAVQPFFPAARTLVRPLQFPGRLISGSKQLLIPARCTTWTRAGFQIRIDE
jgi:hypothetical protein